MDNHRKWSMQFSVSTITIIGFLIALEIILTRFLSINTPIVRIGFGFVPVAIVAVLYGPLWAGLAYAIGDIIGAFLFPTGAFFPGFTLTAFLTGLTFGLFLYGRQISLKTVLPASLIVCILLNLCLDTLWLHILMGEGMWALIPSRLIKCGVMIVIQSALLPVICGKILPLIKVPGVSLSNKKAI
jgi:ECF transporter S component (folate family)